MSAAPRPLFDRFPALAERLPWAPLGDLPTAARRLDALGEALGGVDLSLKDDGRSSAHYGGNKVRKLEFALAAALAENAPAVLTFGYAGSNHATATAVHARRLGLSSISMLLPQENAEYLRRNLLVSLAVGAELHEYPSRAALAAGTALALLRWRLRHGRQPFVVSPGGSSPLGTVGFVAAAFELERQIDEGIVAMPDLLYVSGGSAGTAVGLGLGIAAAGLPIRVVAVRVTEERDLDWKRMAALWGRTNALLADADPSFPRVELRRDAVELRGEFFGGRYALVTPQAKEAIELAREREGLALDGTYTAKALACLVADARAGRLEGKRALFWSTCNSADLSGLLAGVSAERLPRRLRRYFDDVPSRTASSVNSAS